MIIKKEIEELMPYAKKMAEFIHANRIRYVVVPGAGAQTVAYMIKTVWKNSPRLSKEPQPLFFGMAQLKGKSIKQTPLQEVCELIKARMGKHTKSIGKPVFVLDDCYHSGDTINKITVALRTLGFNNIKTGALTHFPKSHGDRKLDFSGAEILCPSFREERKLTKEWFPLKKTRKQDYLTLQRHLRKTIRDSVNFHR